MDGQYLATPELNRNDMRVDKSEPGRGDADAPRTPVRPQDVIAPRRGVAEATVSEVQDGSRPSRTTPLASLVRVRDSRAAEKSYELWLSQ